MLNSDSTPNPNSNPNGWSLVEVVVALGILTIVSGILWPVLRSAIDLEHSRLERERVLELAESEMERVRMYAREQVVDTSYLVSQEESERKGYTYEVLRTVMDSARLEQQTEHFEHPNEFYKKAEAPLEVVVQVYGYREDWKAQMRDREGMQPLISLVLKIPEYEWGAPRKERAERAGNSFWKDFEK